MTSINFPAAFQSLTGYPPFRWQRRLFDELRRGEIPEACDIPTGLGKTSIIPIWLIALATQTMGAQPRFGAVTLPRRLVYVVNRRTVVDQATDVAEKIRERLRKAESGGESAVRYALQQICVDPDDPASPVAISTLRGEFADNREWQADPARAAIVVGTVDMIGSRLLFSGYGAGRSSRRAFSAGLLGQDALLVHDEAHLTKPFGALVRKIAAVQKASDLRPVRVMEMSATADHVAEQSERQIFRLREEEEREGFIARRLDAKKALRIERLDDARVLPNKLSELALTYNAQDRVPSRILIFCQKVEDAKATFESIKETVGSERAALLVGPLRGFERDKLAASPLFQSFKAATERDLLEQTLYLVTTSAGEVGVDFDADHMICDLTTLDSMIQRLGRVNRLGREDESFVAQIDVFDAPSPKTNEDDAGRSSKLDLARKTTDSELRKLPLAHGRHDASPRALRARVNQLSAAELGAAFAPKPRILPATDILFDKWALTSMRDLPGRPAVTDWLHGKEANPPETTVVWREEVNEIAAARKYRRISDEDVYSWFDAHRIEPQERLRETTQRAARAFDALARRTRKGETSLSAVCMKGGKAEVVPLDELSSKDVIANAIVVLPVQAGGLLPSGMLEGTHPQASDVADAPLSKRRIASAVEPSERRWRVRMKKDQSVWSVEAVGHVEKGLENPFVQFNRRLLDDRSIERVVKKLVNLVEECRQPSMWFVEEDRLVLASEDDPNAAFRMLLSFVPAKNTETALDKSEAAAGKQSLQPHLDTAASFAKILGEKLNLPEDIRDALLLAAAGHDWGKDRRPWQRAIGNTDYPHVVLAKSDHRRFNNALCKNYRHEFGSLVRVAREATIAEHPRPELICHLIAAHHGWARPHFKFDLDDPEADGDQIGYILAETPRIYARLQRCFGRWGLAWLEALLKSADVLATKNIDSKNEGETLLSKMEVQP